MSALNEILPFLEKLLQTGNKPFILIAEEVEGEALATLVVNKLQGRLKVAAELEQTRRGPRPQSSRRPSPKAMKRRQKK